MRKPSLSLSSRSKSLEYQFRDSIVVSISACHADDPGSIPGRGAILSGMRRNKNLSGRVEIVLTVNGAMAQR